ncbi:MAG: tRNA (adenosine(37)-N6)-threonylcarbamoyltransferase complex transferase subunit TsaD [Patescibacteria group bacterium]
MKKIVLGIETSCDETAMALIEASGSLSTLPRFKILKEEVASQIKVHRPFGGVVPTLAKREHQRNLPILYRKIFSETAAKQNAKKMRIENVDLIAVTVGPGLEPALWAGITFAQELQARINADINADKRGKKKVELIGTNHLEGHLYSFLLPKKKPTTYFPAIALIVSGGHTILLFVQNLTTWKKLGETRDDAVGEAFDKVARMLGLPYPGGPELERIAKRGKGDAIQFPRPMIHDKSYDFSFSGLKTAVLYYLRDSQKYDARVNIPQVEAEGRGSMRRITQSAIGDNLRCHPRKSASTADVAASFQRAAIDVLVKKTIRAAKELRTRSVMLSGGVAANTVLRKALQKEARKIGSSFFVAEQKYNTDNAVMIAAAGYIDYLRKKKHRLVANGALNI